MIWHFNQVWKHPHQIKQIVKLMFPGIILGIVLALFNVTNVFILGLYTNNYQISACAIGVQIYSIILFIFYSINGGANIYAGQLISVNKIERLQENTRLKIVFEFFSALFACGLILVIGERRFIGLFIGNNPASKMIIDNAVLYLHFLYPTVFLFGLCDIFYWCFNLEKKMHIATVFATGTAVLNIVFSFLFVAPIPHLGNQKIAGIGWAGIIANGVTVLGLLCLIIYQKPIWAPGWRLWSISKWTYKRCLKGIGSILPGEVLYPIYVLIQTAIILRLSNPQVYAGYNIVSVILDLCYSANFGTVSAYPILISKYLARNDFKTAQENSKKVFGATSIFWIIGFLILITGSAWYPSFYNLSPLAKKVATYYLITNAFIFLLYGIAYQCYMTARLGGRYLIFTMLVDVIINYCFGLPILFLIFHYSNHGTTIPYAYLSFFFIIPYIMQFVCGVTLIYKGNWLQNAIHKNETKIKHIKNKSSAVIIK